MAQTRFLRSLRKMRCGCLHLHTGKMCENHLGCALAQVQCSKPQVLKERLGNDPRIREHGVFRSFQMGEGDENVQNSGFRSLRGFHACGGCLGRSIKIPMEQIARSQGPRISVSFAGPFLQPAYLCVFFWVFFSMFLAQLSQWQRETFQSRSFAWWALTRCFGRKLDDLWMTFRRRWKCKKRCVNFISFRLAGKVADWRCEAH